MKLKPMEKKDVPKSRPGKISKAEKVVQSFLKTGTEAAEYVWQEEYGNPKTARSSLSRCIKLGNYPVEIRKSGERIFFIRKENGK